MRFSTQLYLDKIHLHDLQFSIVSLLPLQTCNVRKPTEFTGAQPYRIKQSPDGQFNNTQHFPEKALSTFCCVQVSDKLFSTILSMSGKSPGRLLFVQHLSTTLQVTTVLCVPPLLLPQELAGLFPFFATNISNSTCETTRGRQKSHGLSYHHPHPCRNVSSCQFCTCLRTVFHIYYKVVSLLGRRGKVKSLF